MGPVHPDVHHRPPVGNLAAEVVDEFVCCCGDRLADADELREDARRILEEGATHWAPGPVDDRNFLDAAAGWLEQHSAKITGIMSDQWNLVEVTQTRWDSERQTPVPVLLLAIQCDRVEDGIARAVQLIKQRAASRPAERDR